MAPTQQHSAQDALFPLEIAGPRATQVHRFDDLLERPGPDDPCTEHLKWVPTKKYGPILALTDTGRELFIERMVEVGACYTDHHPDLVNLRNKYPNEITPTDDPDTLAFQMLNIALAHEDLWLSKHEDLARINSVLTDHFGLVASKDPSQSINKTNTWGLRPHGTHGAGQYYYSFPRPLEFYPGRRREYLRDGHQGELLANKEREVERSKARWLQVFVNSDYEFGHRKPGSDELVLQPAPLNGAWRDKFVFDADGLPRIPTAPYLMSTILEEYDEKELVDVWRELTDLARERGWDTDPR